VITLAVWLFALPFRILFALGFRRTVALVCLFVLAVTTYGMAEDLGLLETPAQASPARRKPARKPAQQPAQQAPASRAAATDIPRRYLVLYREAGRRYGVPWSVLAGIGKVESNHGRSRAPGVRSGVNRFGCCAGPMQFNLRNGPPSTWDTYGCGNVYDPADAIPAAARLLKANGAPGRLDQALYAYNHAWWYVAKVKAWAARYRGRH
jgi:Transglycosylase SLT domain